MGEKASLKQLVNAPEILVMPGAHEGISARIAAALGFKALFCSDFGCSAVVLGMPDYGIISLSEMVDQIRAVASISGLPLLGDGGCGYGNALNTFRTVQEYERAGAAGMTLEDQIFPKRCQHLEGKEVVDIHEMVEKIRAALKARSSEEFVISARTDSIQPLGLEEAITRANAYFDAGADMVVPAAIPSRDAIETFASRVRAPVMLNYAEGGKMPPLKAKDLESMGIAAVTYALTPIFSAAKSIWEALSVLKEQGSTETCLDHMMPFEAFTELVGLGRLQDLEEEFVQKQP
jgi:methylisocitrate lyase